MERRQRMTLLGIAAAIAVAAVVVALAAGGGDDGGGDTTGAAPATDAREQPDGRSPAERPDAAKPPEPEVTRIRVRRGEPVGGVAEIEARKGDTVRIDVTSDAPEELHLHVYDLYRPVGPGRTARLRFKADVEGVIELELHGSGNQVAEITVGPS